MPIHLFAPLRSLPAPVRHAPNPPAADVAVPMSTGRLILRLLRLAWQYRGACCLTLLLQIALLGMSLSGLGLTGLTIDVLRHQVEQRSAPPAFPGGLQPPAAWTPLGTIAAIAGGILAISVVNGCLRYAAAVAAAVLSQRIITRLRGDVYEKLHRLSFRFFDTEDVSATINRVAIDVPAISAFIDGVMLRSIVAALSLGVYLAYMLAMHPTLTAACLVVSPLLWIGAVAFSRAVQPLYLRNSRLMDRLVLVLSENVQGIHVIRGFARHREQIARFASANQDLGQHQRRIFWRVSLFQPAMGLVTQLSMLILLSYGGWLVIRGDFPLGAGLFVFCGLLQEFATQIGQMTDVANSMQVSLTGARRVFQILDAPVDPAPPPRAVRLPRQGGELRFERVGFGYQPGQRVLEDMSFTVRPGECVALVGETGSGKSTLLSLIPRFYEPATGRIAIDGTDVAHIDREELRRNIGMVFQECFLFHDTIAANIAFGRPGASADQILRAARIAGAEEFILGLPEGFQTLLGEGGAGLSGGQRQRLTIARALLLDPPILLLDDATAAVDAATEHKINLAIQGAMRGRTTLLATQRVSTLKQADRILVLHNGRVEQEGTHESLLGDCERYRRLIADESSRSRREPAEVLGAR